MHERQKLIEKMETMTQLDFVKASWVNRHVIIEISEQAILLLKALITFEDEELKEVMKTATEFVEDTASTVQLLDEGRM